MERTIKRNGVIKIETKNQMKLLFCGRKWNGVTKFSAITLMRTQMLTSETNETYSHLLLPKSFMFFYHEKNKSLTII